MRQREGQELRACHQRGREPTEILLQRCSVPSASATVGLLCTCLSTVLKVEADKVIKVLPCLVHHPGEGHRKHLISLHMQHKRQVLSTARLIREQGARDTQCTSITLLAQDPGSLSWAHSACWIDFRVETCRMHCLSLPLNDPAMVVNASLRTWKRQS